MWVDKEGDYIAEVAAKTIKTFPSGSVAIACQFTCLWMWSGTEWIPAGDTTCNGDFFIVGKGGNVLEEAVQRFVRATGWSGDLAQIDSPWMPPQMRITVKSEQGQDGKTYYKAAWINPRDSAPGSGLKGASAEEITSTARKYGPLLRAIASKAAVPPASTPPPPEAAPPEHDGSDIPF